VLRRLRTGEPGIYWISFCWGVSLLSVEPSTTAWLVEPLHLVEMLFKTRGIILGNPLMNESSGHEPYLDSSRESIAALENPRKTLSRTAGRICSVDLDRAVRQLFLYEITVSDSQILQTFFLYC
jgi:hypothetical protein